MTTLIAPDELLESLRCTECDLLLSVFPVYIKTDGKTAICGRCKVPDKNQYMRDEAYEGLAQFLVFPCSLKAKGCETALTPLKMKVHEICCSQNKHECSFKKYTRCPWEGSNKNMKDHFESNHEDLILQDRKFEFEFEDNFQGSYVMYFENEMFLMKVDVDAKTKTFVSSVEHILLNEDSQRFSYVLNVATNDSQFFYEFPERSTDPESLNETKFTYDFIKNKVKESSSYTVTAVIASIKEIEDIKQSIKIVAERLEIDEGMLGELECPVCYEYMLPPIYQCLNGHSICQKCKGSIEMCPNCRGGIQNTQNFALEKLTAKMNYPCKYRDFGCTVVLKSERIREHERSCEYGPYKCPLAEAENCDKQATKIEITRHVHLDHQQYILKTDKINVPFGGVGDGKIEKVYIISYANRVFKVCFQYETEKFYWTLQLVGPIEECQLYHFKVEVIDNDTKRKLRQSTRGICVPLTKKEEAFTKRGNYVVFFYEQISHLISEQLTFKVRVIKNL